MRRFSRETALAVLLIFSAALRAEELDRINFSGVSIDQVLIIYREMSGKELAISSNVRRLNATITLRVGPTVPRDEVMKQLDQALLAQAGVVMTKIDTNLVSVTYNDALPIVNATNSPPRSVEPKSPVVPRKQ